MKIYLVGGAVRDQLLNYPYQERDWVVVGSSAEEMLAKGYTPVGKDFPVFLHPETKEEYALARQERKSGYGYAGFEFSTDTSVTLKEDLFRRDLSINAIAQDQQGNIIDPHGGAKDIKSKILRHVSSAFVEDPVRILRVARFAARYYHVGFSIAASTMTLMREMVASGEVEHLVPERVWKEFSRALAEKTPHQFIVTLRECGALKVIMPEIEQLFGVPQPEKHHPEIDTGLHALLSLQRASELSDDTIVRFAALVHDLGKGTTPKDELPRHIAHEKRSLPLIESLCSRLNVPNSFRELSLVVAEFHTHCHRANQLTPKTIDKLFNSLDAYRRPKRFSQFLVCCQADAQGRTGLENQHYNQAEYLKKAFDSAKNIDVQSLVKLGFKGEKLGQEIRRKRIEGIKSVMKKADAKSSPPP